MPDLSGNEEKYVVEAIRSSWISSTGSFLDRFEGEFASACGCEAALGVTNGTSALHLALMALDVRPGDEVLVPSLTYVATANACRYVGAEPVFVDVDPATWCIDPDALESAISRRTRGIIAVHLYGHPADMDRINRVAAIHGLWVVEDAAEAHFATYKGRVTGSLARCATFSFYGNKILTSGEGGAVTVSDPQLELRLRTLRGQGVDPSRRYFFPVTGYNFRMTNVAAALLCAQLERRDEIVSKRRLIYRWYRERLEGTPGLGFQPIAEWAEITPWLMCLQITPAFGRSRDEVMSMLHAEGIDTRPFFVPLHSLPPFRRESEGRGEVLPVTDQLASRGVNLPTYPSMTEGDVDRICSALISMRRPAGSTRRASGPVIRRVGPADADRLGALFTALRDAGDERRFHPHPLTPEQAGAIAEAERADYFALTADGQDAVAYGMLRGWDEGFEVPSLGIAVHPGRRGEGLAGAMMEHLHSVAASRGAPRIRLKVYPDNERAIELYASLGYVFASEPEPDGQVLGQLEIG